MKPKNRDRRLGLIFVGGALLVGAGALTLSALSQSVSYFVTPTELAERTDLPDRSLRLGGLVVAGSVVRGAGTETVFKVTDGGADVTIIYTDVLPDLFREGQGVIVEGLLQSDGRFAANSVLAKHDENYVPKELRHTLDKQGVL